MPCFRMSAENSDDLHISEETINSLYKTAGEETDYTEAIFTYDHEIVVSEQKKTMIRSSLSRLGVNFTPASFQVSTSYWTWINIAGTLPAISLSKSTSNIVVNIVSNIANSIASYIACNIAGLAMLPAIFAMVQQHC